jgi:hypothetical protein
VKPAWTAAVAMSLLLCGEPDAGHAQVFLSSKPHPEFAIGPLFIVGTIRPDLGPVAVRVSWGVTWPPGGSPGDVGPVLYLLCPGEVAEATAPGPPEPGLERHVAERGFTVINRGRLALESRDRTKLGTLASGHPSPRRRRSSPSTRRGRTPYSRGSASSSRSPGHWFWPIRSPS